MGITSEEMNILEVLFDNKLRPLYLQVNEKFEQVNKHLEENAEKMEARFEQIEKKYEWLEKKYERIDKKFEQIDRGFGQIDKRFEQLEESKNQIKTQLNKLETRPDCPEKEIADVRSELEQTKYIIENEIRQNIKIIAENHVDLKHRFADTLPDSQIHELYHLKVNQLESRLVILETRYEQLAQEQKKIV